MHWQQPSESANQWAKFQLPSARAGGTSRVRFVSFIFVAFLADCINHDPGVSGTQDVRANGTSSRCRNVPPSPQTFHEKSLGVRRLRLKRASISGGSEATIYNPCCRLPRLGQKGVRGGLELVLGEAVAPQFKGVVVWSSNQSSDHSLTSRLLASRPVALEIGMVQDKIKNLHRGESASRRDPCAYTLHPSCATNPPCHLYSTHGSSAGVCLALSLFHLSHLSISPFPFKACGCPLVSPFLFLSFPSAQQRLFPTSLLLSKDRSCY